MGWISDLQGEIQDAEKPEAGQRGRREHQEARLAVPPDQDGALPYRAVPPLDEEPGYPAVLVVPIPDPDPGPPLQGVPQVKTAAEDPVGGGAEGDWEVEEPVEDLGPPGGREVQPGSTGLPHFCRCGEAGAG